MLSVHRSTASGGRIPLADGTRLSARLWLPEGAEARPVPAILEYIPYRHRDARGYACLRVDLRGVGDSDGVLGDEYRRQEQDDAVEVIAWIAGQPWCTGAVGMMGISWGGFNALQVPPGVHPRSAPLSRPARPTTATRTTPTIREAAG